MKALPILITHLVEPPRMEGASTWSGDSPDYIAALGALNL